MQCMATWLRSHLTPILQNDRGCLKEDAASQRYRALANTPGLQISTASTMTDNPQNGAPNLLCCPRSDSEPDAPPTQRGPWTFMPEYGCVLHDRVRCVPCAAFISHLEPAGDTQVYRLAHEDQDRASFHDGYCIGFGHAEQEASSLEERLHLANTRIADFVAGLGQPSVPLTREAAYGRGGPGRFAGGHLYIPFNGCNRGGPPARRTPVTAWDAISHDFEGPQPRAQEAPASQPTPNAQGSAVDSTSTDTPTTVIAVDRLLEDLNVKGPTPAGVATLRQGKHWVFTANLVAREQTINEVQRYLLREWHVPDWAQRGLTSTSTPSPTPSLSDSLAHWINYYNQHPRAPCPLGVHRDPAGHINANPPYGVAHQTWPMPQPLVP